jgi:hypothetical protein
MDICIEMIISYLFLFVAFIIDLGDAHNMCAETRCGGHGPPIRFPFRLNTQPHYCGYSGFNLSCTDHTNLTVLELPISVKFFVKEINYKSQVIRLYDPLHCFPRPQLQWLNLNNSSPFRFKVNSLHDVSDYALFNCSPRSEEMEYPPISCLSRPTYQVYPATYITASLISCTKMYSLLSIPDAIIFHPDKFVQLNWSTPDCRYCEEIRGKRCVKSNSSGSGIQCISTHTKGILSIQFISNFLLNYLFFEIYNNEKRIVLNLCRCINIEVKDCW